MTTASRSRGSSTTGATNAPSAVQTIWCELLVGTLVDAGVSLVVISPGSRSTPLVTALAAEAARLAATSSASSAPHRRLSLVTIIDERAAAFYALGAARATDEPVALVCTSGTAGAHYLPALIEAHLSRVPLIAITADRPPELLECGASQTIDQVDMFGRFVRQSFDLGAPLGTTSALHALRRKIAQAITLSRGPLPGPIHLEVPLRKPLEPIAPSTDEDRALASVAHALRGPLPVAPPSLAPDASALLDLAAAITAEPDGIIVVGAMPVSFARARDLLVALAHRAGYPIISESGSQLRLRGHAFSTASVPAPGASSSATFVDHLDLIPVSRRPPPRIVIQLGAEPVAASWPHWDLSRAERWVLAPTWADPTSTARVVLGDVALSLDALIAQIGDRSAPQQRIRTSAWLDTWRDLDARAAHTIDRALAEHPHSEGAAIRAAVASLPPNAIVQVGNSLPIRVVDQVVSQRADDHASPPRVSPPPSEHIRSNQVLTGVRTQFERDHVQGGIQIITQRGAAGIDGLIASAAGATYAGRPVLLVLGDVSFAHDIGGLLAARCAKAPLAILVVDNRGGQIFAGLPVAKAGIDASVVAEHWLTEPGIDPAAVATAVGLRAKTVASADAVAAALEHAMRTDDDAHVTVIHAPVSATGAHDVRRFAIALMEEQHDQPQPTRSRDLERSPYVDTPRGL